MEANLFQKVSLILVKISVLKTTPAESPWNNGVCERHNAIITEMLLKVKNDCQCDWETALA